MIVFDLRCAGGHVFEAWFASSETYEEQRRTARLCCPTCGSAEIGKALMAPAVASAAETRSPAAVKQAMARLAQLQARVLASSEWVGDGFARRARAMHDGDEPRGSIHGQATAAEARALVADGVPVAPLPLPVVPPGELN